MTSRRQRNFVEVLNNEPGIMVASVNHRPGKDEIRLLRDVRAKSLNEVVSSVPGLSLFDFNFVTEEFISPHFGSVEIATSPPEVEPPPFPEDLLRLADELGNYVLLFEENSGEVRGDQGENLHEAVDLIISLLQKAEIHGISAKIRVTGHSAGAVQDEAGLRISDERAGKVMALLRTRNPGLLDYVFPEGVGVSRPVVPEENTEEDRVMNRSVTFEAVFE